VFLFTSGIGIVRLNVSTYGVKQRPASMGVVVTHREQYGHRSRQHACDCVRLRGGELCSCVASQSVKGVKL
jgi:hypothetical protein